MYCLRYICIDIITKHGIPCNSSTKPDACFVRVRAQYVVCTYVKVKFQYISKYITPHQVPMKCDVEVNVEGKIKWYITVTSYEHHGVSNYHRFDCFLKENTPSRVVRGGRSLAGIRRRIPTPGASKWSPDSHYPTSGCFAFTPYLFCFFEEEEVKF